LASVSSAPKNIGSRLELFVDDWLIDRLSGAEQCLHHPVPQEVALLCDRPWEGNETHQFTCLRDIGGLYRMYYEASHATFDKQGNIVDRTPMYTCYAESRDGIHWTRPSLGLFEAAGTRDNNVVLTPELAGAGTVNFVPFVDPRPGVPRDERYKGVGGLGGQGGMFAFVSPDGIHWRKMGDEAIISKGDFDAKNVVFWDAERGEYRAYKRERRIAAYQAGIDDVRGASVKTDDLTGLTEDGLDNGRDISTCASQDFVHWTEPRLLSYTPSRVNELYENHVQPYYRAPHVLLSFPTRYIDRGWTAAAEALPQLEHRRMRFSGDPRGGTALTDCMLMSSRDREHFSVWPESFIRPGLRLKDNWTYGDNFVAYGMIETASSIIGAPDEISIYATEAYYQSGPSRLRRFTIRVDGFVSVRAPLCGGEMLTRPLVFEGSELVMNYSTSAAGSVQVELQDAQGIPLPGFALADSEVMYGDSLEQPMLWKNNPDLATWAGTPVRLRFVLKDADLFSLRFR